MKEEWHRYFDMPVDMNGAQVRDDDKLEWKPLPTHVAQGLTQDSSMHIPNPSVRLENPPVDPTFGQGRTVATRDRELAEYRAGVRAASKESNQLPPIFQADYLLVQLPGRAIALHTVSNGVMLHSASDPEMLFTTVEFEHTPQPGVQGLWGTFRKKKNPGYKADDAKSGAKFVRHLNVSRQHVVVCNVQVWSDTAAKALRIHTASLHELAEARPDEHTMPSKLPDSHVKKARARSKQRATNKKRVRSAGPQNSSSESEHEHDGAPAVDRMPRAPPAPKKAPRPRRKQLLSSDDDDSSDEPSRCDLDSLSSSSDSSDEDDDPPPPIPDEFERYEWDGQPIKDFMLWSKIGKDRHPCWHVGRVIKTLHPQETGGFTHDARFESERYARGTTLSKSSADAGTLVLIRKRTPSAREAASSGQASFSGDQTNADSVEPAGVVASSDRVHVETSHPCSRASERHRGARGLLQRQFCCNQCNVTGEFLYCDPSSPDGQRPVMHCVRCAPSGWVTLSYTDFTRACHNADL